MARRETKADNSPKETIDRTLRGFVGYNMKRAYLVVEAEVRAVLAEFELKLTAFSALTIIADNPDMTQTELAAALSIERSGVVLLVDDLESRELISRNKVRGDRRSYALRATLGGIRLRDKVVAHVAAREARLLRNLTQQERIALRGLLNRIEADNRSVS